VVHLVEVDGVGLQPAQRVLAGPDDVPGREALVVGPVAHLPVDLGGQDDLLPATAALGEPAADDLLGDTLTGLPAVDVGGVEEVDAQLEGLVHDGERRLAVRPEVHRAEAKETDRPVRRDRVLHQSPCYGGTEARGDGGVTASSEVREDSWAAEPLPKGT
jgi:hypothetical protein